MMKTALPPLPFSRPTHSLARPLARSLPLCAAVFRWYGAPNRTGWDVADHVDEVSKGWNGQRGAKIGQRRTDIAPKNPVQSPRAGPAYARDHRVRGKITAKADPTRRPRGGQMTLARGNVAGGGAYTRNFAEEASAVGRMKERMMSGSGNPITGELPQKYNIPSFRDIELLNHRQYG